MLPTKRMISSFDGEYRFLSNFYPAEVEYEGVRYPTVEHAYQAAKTLVHEIREAIRACPSAGQAKRAGRTIGLRPGWDGIKDSTMLQLLREKFFKHKDLGDRLLDTAPEELVVCNGVGLNTLGHLLENVRWELRITRERDGC